MEKTRLVQTVLLVDDDPWVRNAYRISFEDAGKRAFTAENSKDALPIASAERPDLAVVDLRLAGEWGLNLVEKLLVEIPGIEIAVVSGYMCEPPARAAIGCGAGYVFGKPLPTPAATILRYVEQRLPCVDWRAHGFPTLNVASFEHVMRALTDCRGNVAQAARLLAVHRQSLQKMLAKPHLPRWVHQLSEEPTD